MKKLNELNEKEVVNAKTLEDAERLCKMAHELGLNWCNGETYLHSIKWEYYKDKFCYRFNRGSFTNLDVLYYTDTIYDAKEFFDTNSEKTNDLINEQKTFFPEVGKEYEFSNDMVNWTKGELKYYTILEKDKYINYLCIREIQPDQKELDAIEYLKKLGYKIELL